MSTVEATNSVPAIPAANEGSSLDARRTTGEGHNGEQEQPRAPTEKERCDVPTKPAVTTGAAETTSHQPARDDIEGGYGGQEDLEDRYATTYGAH